MFEEVDIALVFEPVVMLSNVVHYVVNWERDFKVGIYWFVLLPLLSLLK
jgi:hypothetical protein